MTPGLRQWGQGGPEALLLHCGLAHSGAWEGVAQHLSGAMRLTAPDLVGHGRAVDHDITQDLHDQSTAAISALLPGDPVHLIGHSFGGTVALRLAIERPERIASLTLIEPVLFAAAAKGSGLDAAISIGHIVDACVKRGDLEAAARHFLDVWGGQSLDAMPPAQQRYMIARMPLITASGPALHGDRAGLVARLGDVTAPVLLVEGSDSAPVIADILDALASGLNTSRRLTVPGAGHMVPITHPAPVAAAVADLAGVTLSTATEAG